MTKWEQFEEYLFDRDLVGEMFNVHAVAEDMGITVPQASRLIQCYLGAQTRQKSRTLFVLRRLTDTRTSNAMWVVGQRTADVREIGKQLVSDLRRRIDRYTEPSLARIAQKNPRALRQAEARAKIIADNVELLAAMLDE